MTRPENIESSKHRWRTLIHVQRVIGINPETSRIQATVPGWETNRRFTMPALALPENIRPHVEADTILFAQVDLSAEQGSQLKPTNFELGPTKEEVDEMVKNDPYLSSFASETDQLYSSWKEDEWLQGVLVRKYSDGVIREALIDHVHNHTARLGQEFLPQYSSKLD